MTEIVNRVEKSGLVQIDLADWYPPGKRIPFDTAPWLYEGMIVREKEFRAYVNEHDWTQYKEAYVAVYCSADVIIPSWAFLLIAVSLEPYAQKVVHGTLDILEGILFEEVFSRLDFSQYQDANTVIKGCGHLPIPQQAYVSFVSRLRPFAKSIMFGEPCSAVPLYKKRK